MVRLPEAPEARHDPPLWQRSPFRWLKFLLIFPIYSSYRRRVDEQLRWRLAFSHVSVVLLSVALISVIGATVGSIAVFLAARYAFRDLFRSRAGTRLARFEEGFRHDDFNYLLSLRLVPVFPFWLVNIVPALLGMRPDQVVFQPSTSQALMHVMFGVTGGIAAATEEFPSIGYGIARAAEALGVLVPHVITPDHERITPAVVRDQPQPLGGRGGRACRARARGGHELGRPCRPARPAPSPPAARGRRRPLRSRPKGLGEHTFAR